MENKEFIDWGKGSRVQTCILEMEKGYKGNTIFKLLPNNK